MIDAPRENLRLTRTLAALLLFGVSFGYVEAAVVVYLRAIYQPMRQRIHPGLGPGELFPLIQPDELRAEGDEHVHRLAVELGREAATLIMLAAIGLAVANSVRTWLAAFMVAFGVWDIFYYVFLKLLIDWPASVWTWDILFLLPVPWVGPVLAPLTVAAGMIAAGTAVLWWESRCRPVRFGVAHAAGVAAGALIIIVAMCWDFRQTTSGGKPEWFNWPLLIVGEVVTLAAFAHALRRR